MLDNWLWSVRIQDVGCDEIESPKRRYGQAKILSIGPSGLENFFYDLTAIAVDIVKSMVAMNVAGC